MAGDEHMNVQDCTGCKHHIGAGLCRMNLERECGEGGHEAWEPREVRSYTREEFADVAVSCGWGKKSDGRVHTRKREAHIYDRRPHGAAQGNTGAGMQPQTLRDLSPRTEAGRRERLHYRVYNGHDV